MKSLELRVKSLEFRVLGLLAAATLLLTGLFLLVSRMNTTVTRVSGTDGFEIRSREELEYRISFTREASGGVFTGWEYLPGEAYTMYNYGIGEDITGTYDHTRIGLKKGTEIEILPTKLIKAETPDGEDHGTCGFTAVLPQEAWEQAEGKNVVIIRQTADGKRLLYDLERTIAQLEEEP